MRVPILVCLAALTRVAAASVAGPVHEAESIYADLNDAGSVVGAIDSGLFSSYRGRDRAQWQQEFRDKRAQLAVRLAAIDDRGLSKDDSRVLAILHTKLDSFAEESSDAGDTGHCADGRRKDLAFAALGTALDACFTEIANSLEFEGQKIDRASALAKLHEIDDPARRKALFYAFAPLWQAINGANEADSPYRRLISMAATEAQKEWLGSGCRGTDGGRDERAAGAMAGSHSRNLEQGDCGRGERTLGLSIRVGRCGPRAREEHSARARCSRSTIATIATSAPISTSSEFSTISSRVPDKSSVAYTDFLIHGRWIAGQWQPTVARVLASYGDGNLGSLNELVHENGHAVHISAIRNRPAYVDWNDDLFVEAFADVTSWSVYEAAWQRRYLGVEAPTRASLRALYGSVMLDVAWALFEARMLRDPAQRPQCSVD